MKWKRSAGSLSHMMHLPGPDGTTRRSSWALCESRIEEPELIDGPPSTQQEIPGPLNVLHEGGSRGRGGLAEELIDASDARPANLAAAAANNDADVQIFRIFGRSPLPGDSELAVAAGVVSLPQLPLAVLPPWASATLGSTTSAASFLPPVTQEPPLPVPVPVVGLAEAELEGRPTLPRPSMPRAQTGDLGLLQSIMSEWPQEFPTQDPHKGDSAFQPAAAAATASQRGMAVAPGGGAPAGPEALLPGMTVSSCQKAPAEWVLPHSGQAHAGSVMNVKALRLGLFRLLVVQVVGYIRKDVQDYLRCRVN